MHPLYYRRVAPQLLITVVDTGIRADGSTSACYGHRCRSELAAYSGVSADCNLQQSSSDLFGYAFDGFPMYGHTDSGGTMPQDLIPCGGHTGVTHDYPDGVYHYHAPLDFPNLPPCWPEACSGDLITTTAASGVGLEVDLRAVHLGIYPLTRRMIQT